MTTSIITQNNQISAFQISQMVLIRISLLAANFEIDYINCFSRDFNFDNHKLSIIFLEGAIRSAYQNKIPITTYNLKKSIELLTIQKDAIANQQTSIGYNLYHLISNHIQTLDHILSEINCPIIITKP